MSWPTISLGEICDIVSGSTPKSGRPEFWDGDVAWVTPKDLSALDGKYLTDTPRKITEAGLKSCSARMLPIGSLLFSSRAPIGHVAITRVPLCTNQGFKSLVPRSDGVDVHYLYWWFKVNRAMLESLGRGATFKEVSKAIVESVVVPLPPLPEQERIARILDAADSLRTKRRESITHLDRLVQSTFMEMFGDPVGNERNWSKLKLNDCVDGLLGGKNVAQSESPTRRRVLKVSAVTKGRYIAEESKYLPDDVIVPSHAQVRQGDLLISRANTKELIGATAYVWETPEEMVLPDKIWKFVWSEDGKVLPIFASAMLQTKRVRDLLSELATGTSGSMRNITKPKLLGLPVIVPPTELQERFCAIVKAIRPEVLALERHLYEIDTLFASLQSRAFAGEL